MWIDTRHYNVVASLGRPVSTEPTVQLNLLSRRQADIKYGYSRLAVRLAHTKRIPDTQQDEPIYNVSYIPMRIAKHQLNNQTENQCHQAQPPQ